MNSSLGKRLDDARKNLGWTQTTLHERSGVSFSSVNRLLRDYYDDPGVFIVSKLCDALGLRYEWAIWGRGEKWMPGRKPPIVVVSTDRRRTGARKRPESGEHAIPTLAHSSVGALPESKALRSVSTRPPK